MAAEDVFVCLMDFETNAIGSFRPPTQTPVQIAYAGLDGTIRSDYISGATRINPSYNPRRLTVAFLEEHGRTPAEVLGRFLVFLAEANPEGRPVVVVAHNAEFDRGLLDKLARDTGVRLPPLTWRCTMRESIDFCDLPQRKFPRLAELAQALQIPSDDARLHCAEYDVSVLRQCYRRGLENRVFTTTTTAT
jgi:DNA polymerase III epsilon subunit-like protein